MGCKPCQNVQKKRKSVNIIRKPKTIFETGMTSIEETLKWLQESRNRPSQKNTLGIERKNETAHSNNNNNMQETGRKNKINNKGRKTEELEHAEKVAREQDAN